jgi:hypothetical protein
MEKTDPSRRQVLIALLALPPVAGCYGSFGLTKKIYGWNGTFSNIVVKEIIFLALVIIPVYGLAIFVDAVILNILEFLTGHPVIASKDLGEGRAMAMQKLTDGTVRVELAESGKAPRVFHIRRADGGGFTLLDDETRQLASTEPTESGALLVLDGKGAIVHRLPPEEMLRMERAVAERPVSELVTEAIREPAANRRLASLRSATQL